MIQNQQPFQGPGQTPSPWFTVANQFVPRNLHDVIRWSRYITIQSPTTSEVIRKLSTYPITDFNIQTTKESVRTKYKEVLKSFRLKESLQNIGFEYFTIGNCFVSIYFPIHRTLICQHCKTEYSAKRASFITFKQYEFKGTCPHCGTQGIFQRRDTKSMAIEDMNIIRWNPEHIIVNHNPITGEYDYYYTIPNTLKNKIQRGDRLSVDSTPWEFIEAVRYNQDFKFDRNNIFHLQNVTTGGTVEGISVPPLLSLFSLVFYQATLRKANEAIATEYLTPLRAVFPQAQTANSDPATAMSLRNFVNNMENALTKHKHDKNHIVIAPVPIGYTPLGGEGKNLLVSQEIQQAEDSILLSLGVSRELLSGTTNWTSTSVGLRMMENLLFSYISRLEELIEWATGKVASYLNIEQVKITLQPFKLLDDDMFKQLLLELNKGENASITTLMEEYGLDFKEEQEKIKSEKVERAKQQVETQYATEQAQTMAAKDVGKRLKDDQEYKDLIVKAEAVAMQLMGMEETARMEAMSMLKGTDYAMYIMASMLIANYSAMQTPQEPGQDPNAPPGKAGEQKPEKPTEESGDKPQGDK
jgi:hypothetical protein